MQQQLKTLDKHLQNVRPAFYAQLNAPLTIELINALEVKYKIKLPEDVKTLYQWKNGQHPDCTEAFVNNSMFITLQEALSSAAEFTAMIGTDFEINNWWNAQWIPIFHNGGGDYICYDMGGTFTGQPGQLIEFWHDYNARKVIAPNLESFLDAINQLYAGQEAGSDEEYFIVNDIEGFPKRFMVE